MDASKHRVGHRAWAWACGPGPGVDGYRLRRWFAALLVWLALLTAGASVSFARYEQGEPAAQHLWLVSLALFYLSLCCIFFPAPTAWIVMLLASNDVALLHSVPLRVLVVSCLCGFATAIANLNEYHLITFLLRYGWVGRVRETRAYHVAARWFGSAPFLVVVAVGFLPLPVDVVRWLAITFRYARWRFSLAYFIGRTPRYAVLAMSTVWFNLGWWEILLVQIGLVVLAGAKVLHAYLRQRARGAEPVAAPS